MQEIIKEKPNISTIEELIGFIFGECVDRFFHERYFGEYSSRNRTSPVHAEYLVGRIMTMIRIGLVEQLTEGNTRFWRLVPRPFTSDLAYQQMFEKVRELCQREKEVIDALHPELSGILIATSLILSEQKLTEPWLRSMRWLFNKNLETHFAGTVSRELANSAFFRREYEVRQRMLPYDATEGDPFAAEYLSWIHGKKLHTGKRGEFLRDGIELGALVARFLVEKGVSPETMFGTHFQGYVFCAYSECFLLHGYGICDEEPYAWEYGPVFRLLYTYLKKHGFTALLGLSVDTSKVPGEALDIIREVVMKLTPKAAARFAKGDAWDYETSIGITHGALITAGLIRERCSSVLGSRHPKPYVNYVDGYTSPSGDHFEIRLQEEHKENKKPWAKSEKALTWVERCYYE